MKHPGRKMSPSPNVRNIFEFQPLVIKSIGKWIMIGALKFMATVSMTLVPKHKKPSRAKNPVSKMTAVLKLLTRILSKKTMTLAMEKTLLTTQ